MLPAYSQYRGEKPHFLLWLGRGEGSLSAFTVDAVMKLSPYSAAKLDSCVEAKGRPRKRDRPTNAVCYSNAPLQRE